MNEGFNNSKTQVLNFKINISSDEGIYVVFENKDGFVTTQKIAAFPIWKTNIEPVYDKYGDLLYDKKEVHYKIYTKENKSTDYCSDCIKSVKYTEYTEINGSTKGLFEIVFSVDRGKGLKNKEFMFLLKSGYENENIVCGTLKTKLELQKEEQERIRNEREIEKRNLDEDSKRIESIKSLLSSNQVDLAVEEFKKLHINNENVKQKIQNALNHYYEKQSLVLHPDILSKIISENKDSFKKIKDGQFKIVLNKDGSFCAESKDTTSKKNEICSNRSYLIKNGFEYPATFTGDFTISTNKTIMNAGDSIRYIVSEKRNKKSIYISKKGEYYFGQFGAPFSADMCKKPIFLL